MVVLLFFATDDLSTGGERAPESLFGQVRSFANDGFGVGYEALPTGGSA